MPWYRIEVDHVVRSAPRLTTLYEWHPHALTKASVEVFERIAARPFKGKAVMVPIELAEIPLDRRLGMATQARSRIADACAILDALQMPIDVPR